MAFGAITQELTIFRMMNPGSLEVDLIFETAQMSLGALCEEEGGRPNRVAFGAEGYGSVGLKGLVRGSVLKVGCGLQAGLFSLSLRPTLQNTGTQQVECFQFNCSEPYTCLRR